MDWTVEREWPGATVFIVGGGPSVAGQDLPNRLRGERVIVINSSWRLLPFADICFTMDPRWLREHVEKLSVQFQGRVATVSQYFPERTEIRRLTKRKPKPGLSRDPRIVVCERTGMQGAINLAAHLIGEGGEIVLLGADGKADEGGRTHHHAPHRWPQKPGCWDLQAEHLLLTVAPMREWGIKCVNASPSTAWGFIWPTMELEDILAGAELPSLEGWPKRGAS